MQISIPKSLTRHPYIIIDDNQENLLETKAMASRFERLIFSGSADNYEDGLDLILEHRPKIVFLEIDPENKASKLSLALINEVHRYLRDVPRFIITSRSTTLILDALRHEVLDYHIKPMQSVDLRKTLLRYEMTAEQEELQTVRLQPANIVPILAPEPSDEVPVEIVLPIISDEPIAATPVQSQEEKPLVICVKSYGDYRFINADDICYLQADNNSTDIHLNNGEMITAFKTLKHFETVLNSPFVRIHNSYIVNIDYVSRIHTGNSVCYIKNTATKLPFSKSYKENVDAILNSITTGNYLEI